MRQETFSLVNKTRGATPRIPFRRIKTAVLGERYALSLALLPPREARRVTRASKGYDRASNVLSFPLSQRSGEILLCPGTARVQAPAYGLDARAFLARLFIHGLLHLKGMRHGATMEHEERRIAKRFGLRL